jgi:hypothetical protein
MQRPLDVLVTMFHAVDDLAWDVARSTFAPVVETDYTSLWGGAPARLAPDELIAGWRELLPGFDATHHHIGPILVIGERPDEVTCTTNVRAGHWIVTAGGGRERWEVIGRYVVRLTRSERGWAISAIMLRAMAEEGDRRVVDLARERVAAGHVRTGVS